MSTPYRSENADPAQSSVGELIGEISDDLSKLFRQEVELAKAEIKQEASKAGKAAGMRVIAVPDPRFMPEPASLAHADVQLGSLTEVTLEHLAGTQG